MFLCCCFCSQNIATITTNSDKNPWTSKALFLDPETCYRFNVILCRHYYVLHGHWSFENIDKKIIKNSHWILPVFNLEVCGILQCDFSNWST